MSPDIVICAIYSVVEQSKRNVSSCLTVFFFTPFPDIIDNSKIITDECRKKVNKRPTSIWFVVQTFVIIPWQECSFDCLDQIQMYFMKYIKHLMGFFPPSVISAERNLLCHWNWSISHHWREIPIYGRMVRDTSYFQIVLILDLVSL